MRTKERLNTGSFRPGAIMALVLMLGPFLSACQFWEQDAPSRSFSPDDLLLDGDAVPTGWEVLGPFPLTGHDLCTTECTSMGFVLPGLDGNSSTAMQEVFRYRSSGIAERTFDAVYVPFNASLEPVSEWSFTSQLAGQVRFGCGFTAGNVRVVCEWAGRYEEYIVTFMADRDPPGPGLTLPEMEQVVMTIDARMEQYVGETSVSQ